jgi:hypothetical protein
VSQPTSVPVPAEFAGMARQFISRMESQSRPLLDAHDALSKEIRTHLNKPTKGRINTVRREHLLAAKAFLLTWIPQPLDRV